MRLLKFDTINPQIYITDEIRNNYESFRKMSRKEILEWIISTRGNFSDYYTYNLRLLGWEAEEFFANMYYVDKVADELYGFGKKIKDFSESIKNKIRPVDKRWERKVIIDYIKKYKPDVILVRENFGLSSEFWRSFDKGSLLVSRLAAPVPKYWSPNDWDLILTSTEIYKKFFEINGVESFINHNGFDSRILSEVENKEKKYDVTFVGGLGNRYWVNRTRCVKYLSSHINFKWWGYNGDKFPKEHPVRKSWQGVTSGLKMFEIYKQSKIVFNDYGEVADGFGVNQRMFEVMGIGTLLLTREAENLKREYPDNIFVTFKDEKDCLDKIKYYLVNEKEREEIALRGQKFMLENFSYKELMKELDIKLKESYEKKFRKTSGK